MNPGDKRFRDPIERAQRSMIDAAKGITDAIATSGTNATSRVTRDIVNAHITELTACLREWDEAVDENARMAQLPTPLRPPPRKDLKAMRELAVSLKRIESEGKNK